MDLSVLIPARNEIFLGRTIDSVLQNLRGDTEVIAVLDGYWPNPGIPDHPRLTLVHHESIGQRAATNEAARISQAKYVMKLDAHCTVDEGFDIKMMQEFEHDWTVIPTMYNLHAFDWICKLCGFRQYQGPQPQHCGQDMEMEVVWKAKSSPTTTAMAFDKDLHFQYWGKYRRQQQGDMVETMSLLGACFMMERSRYWELDGLDEAHGSWGQMGTEIACKTWLSGGRLLCSRRTWFSHMFRTKGGFSFPYPMSDREQRRARDYSRWLWHGGNWPKAKHPLSWLVEKFAPVPGWETSCSPAENR